MSLRFLADHCVPNAIVEQLRTLGHEVMRLRDHIDPESPDSRVIAAAQELDALLLSLNGDFADIVSYPPANYRGIIALQVRDHPEVIESLMKRLTAYLAAHPEQPDYRGRLLIVEPHRIRVRE